MKIKNIEKLKPLNSEETVRIASELEMYDSVFYQLWNLGSPMLSTEIPTAAVAFNDTDGQLMYFILNPTFWESLSFEQKKFVICHESLHVIYQHGVRFSGLNKQLANYAADIVINHALINRFGFSRQEIDPKNIYCWVDKFFDSTISDDMNFEYYYNLLLQQTSDAADGSDSQSDGSQQADGESNGEGDSQSTTSGKASGPNNGSQNSKLVDEHNFDGDASKILEKLGENLPDSSKHKLKEMLDNEESGRTAGTTPGNNWLVVNVDNVKKKKKWETVIKKWALKYMKDADKSTEQWARLNRRMTMLPRDMFLPSDMEVEEREKDEKKIDVWFFQDTSGSCMGFAKRFFTAAKSLPTERFNIRLFCFDTSVYETSLASGRLSGFGGTSFTCIEDAIQRITKKEGIAYPMATFVISDGYANGPVRPQYPKKWYWFLSHNYTHCIPSESHIFKLADFE